MRNATLRPSVRAARKEQMDDERDVQTMAAPRPGRWLLWLAGLVVAGIFGGVVWYAYVEGLAGLGGEPPLIRAAAGPYKRVPEDRGGLDVANQSASVIDVFRPAPESPRVEALPPAPEPVPQVDPTEPEPRLAAPPDEPDPASLPPVRAEETPPPQPLPPPAEPEQVATPAPAPVPIPPPAPAQSPVAEAPPAEPPPPPVAVLEELPAPAAEPALVPEAELPALGSGGWIPVPKPPPPAPVAAAPRAAPPPPPPALEAREEPPPRRVARAAEPPRPPAPAVRPRPERQPVVVQRRPVEREPAPVRRAPPPPSRTAAIEPTAPVLPPAPAVPPAPVRSSAYRLQLLALRSEGAMDQAWSQLRQRYPRVLSDLSPSVERIATVSGTMYRLQAGPFASREAATDACSAIQSQGGQCFVVGSAE